ncbi:MAG: LytTR family DNA-binding domain-containing protein [Eubacteriales bacterium]|nr:LytTR family DNA-binding domain-containing protein [Eubacteriales bacterium]
MYRIAICDDEQLICSQIENIILKHAAETNEKIETQVFYSGEELYKFLVLGEGFDLIFLDIEMRMLNGIEVGRRIRDEMDNQITQIVYVSGKDNYYKELFDVRPMHFLHKPVEAQEIIGDIRLAMKLSDKLGGVFSYKKGREVHRIDVKDILYFESNNREVRIVKTDDDEIFYGKLNDVFKQVAKYYFMFIHKSYIVNYIFVTKFKYEEVTMSNSEVLPISQSRRKSIRELQIRFEKEGVL